MLCEMQSVLSRIWTHVTMSISYDDNYYTTDTYTYWNCITMTKQMIIIL